MGLVGLQSSEEARGVCWSAGSTVRTRVPHPSLQACNRQTSLLCQRRSSSHRAAESVGPVFEVAKQPKSWKGLRGHSELAVTSALPEKGIVSLTLCPMGSREPILTIQYIYPPIPAPAGLHTPIMGNFRPLNAAFILWQLWRLNVLTHWEECRLVASTQWSQLCPPGPHTPCVLSARGLIAQ